MVILKDQNKSVTKEYIELSKMYPECSPLVSVCFEQVLNRKNVFIE